MNQARVHVSPLLGSFKQGTEIMTKIGNNNLGNMTGFPKKIRIDVTIAIKAILISTTIKVSAFHYTPT